MEHAQAVFQVSERRVCRALEQPRSTQRYHGKETDDEEMLTERIITLASQYGRYGYRRTSAIKSEMLNNKYPENMQQKEREHISFSYGMISWTIQDGGITTSADWSGASISR